MDNLQQLLDERLEAQTTPLNKVHSSTIHRKETTVNLDNKKTGIRNESAMGKDLSVKIDKQQADKNCDLDDLFAMINKLVVKALKKDNVEFNPDEGARFVVDQQVPVNHPIIQFDVISYEPKLEKNLASSMNLSKNLMIKMINGSDTDKFGHKDLNVLYNLI